MEQISVGISLSLLWVALTVAAIAVACQDSDIRNLSTLIIGPPDSPYQFGFFEVGPLPRTCVLTDSVCHAV